jgi:hypothetical protein
VRCLGLRASHPAGALQASPTQSLILEGAVIQPP